MYGNVTLLLLLLLLQLRGSFQPGLAGSQTRHLLFQTRHLKMRPGTCKLRPAIYKLRSGTFRHGLSWVRRNLELCYMSATRRTSRKRSIVSIDARMLGLWRINDGSADMRILPMRPSPLLTGRVSLTGLNNCPVTNWKSDAHGQLAAWIPSVAVV